MPSMVLLMRSRLRMRPLSFSMRMPKSSWYWRLILRRPASSLGRSASSSVSSTASAKLGYRSRLAVLLLRVLAIAALSSSSARACDVAAVLIADQEEATPTIAGEHRDLAFRAATRAEVLVAHIAA